MAFEGYLLKGTKNNMVFPAKYIVMETWDSTPKQKEYLKAYRDDNTRNLTKVAAAGKKSTFKFTIPVTHLSDRMFINDWITANGGDEEIEVKYWDDKNLAYSTGSFYIPNLNFKIIKHTANDIMYDKLEIEFIEN